MTQPHQHKAFSTLDVPSQFLEAVFLVGHVPQRVLASDPRISYCMYVPPPPVYTSTPSASQPRLPLLVFVHSTGRDLSPMRNDLAAFARSIPCAVVAPLFPAGLDGPEDVSSYKVLRSGASGSFRSDVALLDIVAEIAVRYPGLSTDKFYLMGFSGGGQFSHRFMYMYPDRLAGVATASPGTITKLNYDAKWPDGIGDSEELFGRPVNTDLVKKVPMKLFIGSEDTELHGGPEFWTWLKNRQVKQSHGDNGDGDGDKSRMESRVDGARALLQDWQRHGIECELQVVHGAAHEKDPIREKQLEFMESIMQSS